MRGTLGKLLRSRAIHLVLLGLVTMGLAVFPLNIGHEQDSLSLLSIGVGHRVVTIGTQAMAAGTIDYTCDGTDDNAQFTLALNALPLDGGELFVFTGNYSFSATPTRAIANVSIVGVGMAVSFTRGGGNPVFTAGGDNWTFSNFQTDAGGVNVGATTGWSMNNVRLGATYYAYRTSSVAINDNKYVLPVTRPPDKIMVGVLGGVGNPNGDYYYSVAFVTANGTTEMGARLTVDPISPINQKVELSNIPISADPRVIARNIYRTKAGGNDRQQWLVTTIDDNFTTTYTDNTPDAALTIRRDHLNTTAGVTYTVNTTGVINYMMVADEQSTSFGYGALQNHNTMFNTAVGGFALQGLSGFIDNTHAGGANVAIGWYAMQTATTGEDNTIIGTGAMENSSSASYNTAMGRNALDLVTTGNGNTAVGYVVGRKITSGSYNTLLGYEVGDNISTGSRNIAIGYSVDVPNPAGSNQLNIGDFLRGQLPVVDDYKTEAYAYDNTVGAVSVMKWVGNADPYVLCGRDDTGVSLNTITDIFYLTLGAGGSNVANGFGVGVPFYLSNNAHQVEKRGYINLSLTDATDGAENTTLRFGIMDGGSLVEKATISRLGLGIGTSSPIAVLDIVDLIGQGLLASRFGSNTDFTLRRASNTQTVPQIVANGDLIGLFGFRGYSGSTYAPIAQIRAYVDGVPGAVNDMPGRLELYTTPDNSGTATKRFAISNNGTFNMVSLPIAANNAAAQAGGLVAGDLYRTGADPDVVCIVH